jgi:hypothetical protein
MGYKQLELDPLSAEKAGIVFETMDCARMFDDSVVFRQGW